jgi:hypothetical protein
MVQGNQYIPRGSHMNLVQYQEYWSNMYVRNVGMNVLPNLM